MVVALASKMYNKNQENSEFSIPDSVLSDICSRFIINIPEEDRNDLIRVFFQIEIAHWFYLDFYCDDSTYSSSSSAGSSGASGSSSSSGASGSSNSSSSSDSATTDDEDEDSCNLISRSNHQSALVGKLKPCSIRQFAALIFRYCPYLMQHSHNVDEILSDWRLFKHAVPTNGAIILDEQRTHVLLVQGFWAKASWGFPKGKVNEHESEATCARREVLEETGFDIESFMRHDQYLQIQLQEQIIRLYIVDNVSMNTKFEPRTRKEIKEVRWFPIHDLPVHRKDHRCKHKLGFSPNSFFMVIPFVKSLRQWIAIQDGKLQNAQLINGSIVHNSKTPNNSASIKQPQAHSNSTKSNNRATTATSHTNSGVSHHRRRNSHSHSGGFAANNSQHHYNHNSHHNHSSNSFHQQSLNYDSSPSSNQQQQRYHYHQHNNHHYNHQHLKAMSRSNENLSSVAASNALTFSMSTWKQQAQKKQQSQQPNVFLKHFAKNPASSIIDESSLELSAGNNKSKAAQQQVPFKNQAQYYQKVQQDEIADLLSLKEISSTKANTIVQNLGQNSKFKPVISSSNSGNIANKNKQKQKSNSNHRRPATSTCKELQFNHVETATMKNSSIAHVSNTQSTSKPSTAASTTKCSSKALEEASKAKKHLDFNGPECWINFKFDYNAISPPINLKSLIQL